MAGAGPTLRITGEGENRTAGFAGLVTCGSVWACPVCARKIAARRAQEIDEVVTAATANGGSAALITLTLRHHSGHRLSESWDALRYAWSRVTSGRGYQDDREQFGIVGWVAAVEVTIGEAGWHPHLHVLLVLDSPVSRELLDELAGRWFVRWERALGRRGFAAVAEKGGLDARPVDTGAGAVHALAEYLSKVAREVTGGPSKRGRRGNRTPFQVLADGLATGLADDIEAWWHWESASHGRRQVTWSRGLREFYGLKAVQSDEEIAAEDMGGEDVLALPADTWRAVRPCAEELLAAAEADGRVGAEVWLASRGLAFTRATLAPRRRRRLRIAHEWTPTR